MDLLHQLKSKLYRIIKPGAMLPVFILAIIGFSFGVRQIQKFNKTAEFQSVCRMVYDKHYLGAKELKPWYDQCLRVVRDSDDLYLGLKAHLAKVPSSHLDIYTPTEHKKLWEGKAQYTGLKFRGINGRIILYDKHIGQKSDILLGSELVAIDGKPVLSLEGLSQIAGRYTFKLVHNEERHINIELYEHEVDRSPVLNNLGKGVGHLKIETFRNNIFGRTWGEVAMGLKKYKKIIVDLRGNWGGGFSSLMKALSPFLCEEPSAGKLVSPRVSEEKAVDFNELSDQEDLLAQIGQVRSVVLVATEKHNCFKGKVDILVDEETRSVSEMFAAALKSRGHVKVKGQKTSGAVVLAVWYDLDFFGKDFSLSIPEALYFSPSGEVIEGVGLEPDEYLFYDLAEARRGVDSWLQ